MSTVPQRQGDYASQNQASSSAAAGSSMAGGNGVHKKPSRRGEKEMIGNWRIGRTIGKGSSGRVKIAKHAVTGKYAAIKIVPKQAIISSRMSMAEAGARADKIMLGIEREIVIMKLIDHPNVLNLYDVWETSQELYLIMEYVPGGELFDYLVKRGRLPVSEALHYFQQIIYAVDYCHRFNICHRDLKPENLLLDKDKNIKVADFGMAAWEADERMLETSCGSPHYASPEIVAGKAYHGSSSDIWSCGIILFALLTGRLPFDDDNIRSLLQKVKVGVFEMPDEIKDPARDLLKRMLEKDPIKRISMPEILTHPFFVSRPPRQIPGRALVSPPALDEVERPVISPEDIDSDIMGNLKTLWSGASEKEIIAALMSKDKTWEKAIYHLLIKYRNKHLENYNMDEDEDVDAQARRAARKAGQPSPAKRKGGPPPTVKTKLEPLGENETIQDRAPSPVPRPAGPTPKKAAGKAVMVDSPAKARSPMGPRPPLKDRASSKEETMATPSIMVQEATPTKELPLAPSRPQSMVERPGSPLIQQVPQVQDEQLQHFFNEVALQLNTMNIRSSVASGSSGSSAILGSDYHAYLSYAAGMAGPPSRPGSVVNPLPSPGPVMPPTIEETQADPNQFADADDDDTTEIASLHSYMPPPSPIPGQSTAFVGLGIGGPPPSHGGRPSPFPTGHPNNRWSYASSTASSNRTAVPLESPHMVHTPHLTWAVPEAQAAAPMHHPMQAQRVAPPPPRPISRVPPPTRPNSVIPSPRPESSMARDASYVIVDSSSTPSDPSTASWSSRQSGFSAHRGQDAFGLLRKKSKKSAADIPPLSPALSSVSAITSSSFGVSSGSSSSGPSSSDSSPKRSWFNNLFNFKPPTSTLIVRDNIGETREKIKKLLNSMGARVQVVEIDGLRALKCRMDEVKDTQGQTTVIKGVRFKVEFARSTTLQTTTGAYNTQVTMTLEKGAQSAFKNVHAHLRKMFEDPASGANAPLARAPPAQQQQPHSAKSYTASRTAPSPNLAPPVRYTASAPNTPMVGSAPRFAGPQSPASVQLPAPIRF